MLLITSKGIVLYFFYWKKIIYSWRSPIRIKLIKRFVKTKDEIFNSKIIYNFEANIFFYKRD